MPALTPVAVDLHAWYTGQRLWHVLVRQLADILRQNDIDNLMSPALGGPGRTHVLAQARYDDVSLESARFVGNLGIANINILLWFFLIFTGLWLFAIGR
ncbi:hypothetical protein AV944_09305 [Sphingomonas sp. LK11]|nr:hypothetical protein AV944_09305 [Sphingomonas sp. LK11]